MAATWVIDGIDVTDREAKIVSVTGTRTDAADPGSPRTVTVPGILVGGDLAVVGVQVVEALERKADAEIAGAAKEAALQVIMAPWPAWLESRLNA